MHLIIGESDFAIGEGFIIMVLTTKTVALIIIDLFDIVFIALFDRVFIALFERVFITLSCIVRLLVLRMFIHTIGTHHQRFLCCLILARICRFEQLLHTVAVARSAQRYAEKVRRRVVMLRCCGVSTNHRQSRVSKQVHAGDGHISNRRIRQNPKGDWPTGPPVVSRHPLSCENTLPQGGGRGGRGGRRGRGGERRLHFSALSFSTSSNDFRTCVIVLISTIDEGLCPIAGRPESVKVTQLVQTTGDLGNAT
mmetsp:Transcript_18968/g.56865  ORF Transcript_18968/g.56865 Transcript_18968/m.56865 type:complete len:252 (-) Transcript_18968:89-844(-)